jgi:tetratricopeptide (TPR) repeat protein
MTQAELEATLVDRAGTASRVSELLRKSALSKSKHNILLLGPRGIGKSHLTAVIYHRLASDKSIMDKLAIAYLREDEWGITSLLDLLIRIYEANVGNQPGLKPISELSLEGKSPLESEEIVWSLIREILADRSLLVIIENLDIVLGNMGAESQKRFRALVQTTSIWSFLATSTTVPTSLSDQRSPFYGFFDLIKLAELTVQAATTLLRCFASYRGDKEMEAFVTSPTGRARVRAIQHIAGGNPRVFAAFYDVLLKRSPGIQLDDYILEPLQKTIDSLTPYYQSKMTSISPLQQKIILYLCQRKIPSTVTAIARGTLSSHQTIAHQLRQLLDTRYVRVNRLGRESYYELSEPLMRICIEAKSHDGEPLRLLVEFLRYWFYRKELETQLSIPGTPGDVREYLLAALREYDSADGHQHFSPDIARLCVQLTNSSPSTERSAAEELATFSKIAEDWKHCVRALVVLERVEEVIPLIEKALRQHPDDVDVLLALGRAYGAIERNQDALEMFKRAIDASPKNGQVWYEKGRLLARMEQYADALIALDTSLKLDPSYANLIRSSKAEVLTCTGRYRDALKTLHPALRSGGRTMGVFGIYGWALYELERYEEAIEYFKKSLESFPSDQMAQTFLGLCFERLNRPAEALKALEAAYRMNPENRWTTVLYCGALLDAKDYSHAVSTLPTEIVSHTIFHMFLEAIGKPTRLGVLQNRLIEIEGASPDDSWQRAFQGALIEFLGHASEVVKKQEEIRELELWQAASLELFGGRPEYRLYVDLLNVLVRYKSGEGLKALLTLPLEQRRLLIGEAEEKALGRT